jgi:hypothetical protein
MRSTDLEFPGLNRARFVHVKLLECLSALLQLLLYQQYMAHRDGEETRSAFIRNGHPIAVDKPA